MGQRKIKIKRIENATTRQVTFSKRRGGLLKKAHDLAVLCDAEVGVIIFSGRGKLFQFASPSMERILERFVGISKGQDNNNSSENAQMDKLDRLISKSHCNDDHLEHLSLKDLIHLEAEITGSLLHIRTKKEELVWEQLQDFKQKVTEAQRATNVTADILEVGMDFSSSELTGSRNSDGQGNSKHQRLCEASRTDAALYSQAYTSEPTGKRFLVAEDLNESPNNAEE